ncbi:MAG: hypothetical protein CMH83_14850 [Nocardioides sp.]|nr:hypothetical protein [Nocardioides sp.]
MPVVPPTDATARVPRWWAWTLLGLLVAVTLGVGAPAWALGDDAVAWSMRLLSSATALLAVATWSAVVRARRTTLPPAGPDGVLVLRSPLATVAPLVLAWLLVYPVAGLWAWSLATDPRGLTAIGSAAVVVLGALASLPSLARLLTGGLHRPVLVAGPGSLHYRGGRTTRDVPAPRVGRAALQDRPAAVRVTVRGEDDLVLPTPAFAESPAVLLAAVRRVGRG